MFRVARKQHKIFNFIITFNPINMMNSLFFFKISSNIFFHNKTMFSNIPLIITKWMLGTKNHNITRLCYFFTSFPSSIFISFCFSSSRYFNLISSFFIPWYSFIPSNLNTKLIFIPRRMRFFKMTFTSIQLSMSFYKSSFRITHIISKIKWLCSVCLEVTVKLLTHTKSHVLKIENPSLLSNWIIA